MVIIWLMMVNNYLVGGKTTTLKNDGVSNSWDDDIPNIWKIKTTNQNIDMINIIKDTSIGKLDTVDRLD